MRISTGEATYCSSDRIGSISGEDMDRGREVGQWEGDMCGN